MSLVAASRERRWTELPHGSTVDTQCRAASSSVHEDADGEAPSEVLAEQQAATAGDGRRVKLTRRSAWMSSCTGSSVGRGSAL